MKNINGNGNLHPLGDFSAKTVLAVGAHPDDLELAMGGTLACLSEAGARVVMAIVSIPSQLEIRKEESARAAEILGCEIRFLVPDQASRVEDLKHYQLVGMIDGLIRETAPAAVFSHGPNNYHMDHKLVYEACLSSQRLGRFDHFCYAPTSCYAVNTPFTPQAFVDISDKINLKMKAIYAHSSQFGQRGLTADHCRQLDLRNGQIMGVDYAEGLEISRLKIHWTKYIRDLAVPDPRGESSDQPAEWRAAS